MNTADTTAHPASPTILSLATFTAQENALFVRFARPCIRTGGWDALSGQYLAMKEECCKRGLRACSFPQFREVVRRSRWRGRQNRCLHPYGFEAMSVSRGPKLNFLDFAVGWRWARMGGR